MFLRIPKQSSPIFLRISRQSSPMFLRNSKQSSPRSSLRSLLRLQTFVGLARASHCQQPPPQPPLQTPEKTKLRASGRETWVTETGRVGLLQRRHAASVLTPANSPAGEKKESISLRGRWNLQWGRGIGLKRGRLEGENRVS